MGRYSSRPKAKTPAERKTEEKALARRDKLVAKEEKKLGYPINFDDDGFVSMSRGHFSKSQSEQADKHEKAVKRLNDKGIFQ